MVNSRDVSILYKILIKLLQKTTDKMSQLYSFLSVNIHFFFGKCRLYSFLTANKMIAVSLTRKEIQKHFSFLLQVEFNSSII